MRTTYRLAKIFIVVTAALQLSACLSDDSSGSSQSGPSIAFTNPANTSVIQTPDIVVNIAGTVSAESEVESVTWQNDRGGKGTATGTDKFVTGNIVLQLGTNNITITAQDKAGAASSKTLTVERENTAPSSGGQGSVAPVLMYSYSTNLGNAAPVRNASIRRQPVYFFLNPGSDWSDQGIDSIRILCCKGQAGPGQGESYGDRADLAQSPWVHGFDLSGFEIGGTRRVRVEATLQGNAGTDSAVFDFIVADSSSNSSNTAPLISGTPQPTATAGVQYSFRPSAQDPDGDTMQFSVSNKPAWASFNSTTGRLFGTPTTNDVGRHDGIVISVSDGQVSSSLPPFSIEVESFGNGSATLTWTVPTHRTDNTALTNLAGYNIYYGQTSGDYANKARITNAGITNYVVDNLSSGRWFFVITAVDSGGLESNPSNEGSKSF